MAAEIVSGSLINASEGGQAVATEVALGFLVDTSVGLPCKLRIAFFLRYICQAGTRQMKVLLP